MDTLRVKDRVGRTLSQRDQYTKLRLLQEQAYHGVKYMFGVKNEDILDVMDNLACTTVKLWQRKSLEKVYAMHK